MYLHFPSKTRVCSLVEQHDLYNLNYFSYINEYKHHDYLNIFINEFKFFSENKVYKKINYLNYINYVTIKHEGNYMFKKIMEIHRKVFMYCFYYMVSNKTEKHNKYHDLINEIISTDNHELFNIICHTAQYDFKNMKRLYNEYKDKINSSIKHIDSNENLFD